MKRNYHLRYSKDYFRKVAIAHQKLKAIASTCVCCFSAQVEEMHHTEYGVEEKLGHNYFGVCSRCHKLECHSKKNWIKSREFPELMNRNTDDFVEILKFNHELLFSSKADSAVQGRGDTSGAMQNTGR